MSGKLLQPSLLTVLSILFATSAAADLNKVPYPRIDVDVANAYQPDAAFEAMRKAFADATARKDTNTLFTLVAPGFTWTVGGVLAEDFDPGREPLHNFKVLFGFRQLGKDTDGGVDEGPFWAALEAFAKESTFYQPVEGGNLVCSPIAGTIGDEDVFADARAKVESEDEAADWFFALRETPVAKAPGEKGPPVGRLGQEAVPVMATHPEAAEGESAPTHFEILLPSGNTGWVAASAMLPVNTARLCYALTPGGAWKIALYDGLE